MKLSKLNPFSSSNKPKVVQKEETNRIEEFRDKVKGLEYKIQESSKMQNKENQDVQPDTIGSKIGNFVDASLHMLIVFFIGGLLLLFFTGFNIFKRIKSLAIQANKYRKALKQTVSGIEKAKPKMNGDKETVKEALRDKQDADTKSIITELKNE